ncbi:MAG: hypothetical protein CL840_21250 [Crocinitomicaceae bacterium]|nr:hypothetical protein [Crocinitomicaceae bacterium]|tara:strand:- start:15520 stop:15930 length:411 start_codon:yes stop_codon:yes gene_type:complete
MKKRKEIQELYETLVNSKENIFPTTGKITVSTEQGVYIVYSPTDEVLHVGRTNGGKNGLNQRLLNHVRNQSSFSKLYMQPNSIKLRGTHKFKYLEVENAKDRAYLESLTAGTLCPEHIGTGLKRKSINAKHITAAK